MVNKDYQNKKTQRSDI